MRVPGVPYVQGRNDYSDRDGRKYGVAIHNTSNDASASGEASYATRRTDGISAHFYVDDREVIQSIDTKYRTGHAGSSTGNENAVSVEITGTNGKSRQWWLDNVAWDRLAQVLAIVCREYGIEPRRASVAEMKANPRVRAFYGHNDMRLAWGGTTHTDPGDNFPWDHLLTKVKQAMSGDTEDDMQLSDKVPLMKGNDVQYTGKESTVGGLLASTNYYVLAVRNQMIAAEAREAARDAAQSALLERLVAAAGKPMSDEQVRELIDTVRAAAEEAGRQAVEQVSASVRADVADELAARLQS